MKSFIVQAESDYLTTLDFQSGGGQVESPDEPVLEESSDTIPLHPLGLKPSGNQYTASVNSKRSVGPIFAIFPDEILSIFLEYLDVPGLLTLGSSCKFLYAFSRSDDLWKTLFIE